MVTATMAPKTTQAKQMTGFKTQEKPMQVRYSNITAAKSVSDAIRTSLGPRGLDKMIETGRNEVVVSNDGATIMKQIAVLHPAARMLVDLSQAQDAEAGDGTTSVVVFAGSLLAESEKLLGRGVHPTKIVEGFKKSSEYAIEQIGTLDVKIAGEDRETLLKCATTSLGSKIVSQYSSTLAPIAVDSVLRVSSVNPATQRGEVSLKDIRIVKLAGGTLEDTFLSSGVVLRQPVVTSANGPRRIEKAKIGLIQFQLSPPKPDLDNSIVVSDYRQMDQILKEERTYLLGLVKKIKKTGCNVLLIQKSILRDAVNSLSLHFLSKLKIMTIKEVERDEIEFLTKSLGCKPIADIDSFTEDKLGVADLVEESEVNGCRFVQVTGIKLTAASSSSSVAATTTPAGAATTATAASAGIASPSTTAATSSSAATAAAAAAAAQTSPLPPQKSIVEVKKAPTSSIVIFGANNLILDEAERSIHDAQCVVRSLIKRPSLVVGGGALEIELSKRLMAYSKYQSTSYESLCFAAFANALEVIPVTLAENSGLNPVQVITELRNLHELGHVNAGINVKKGAIDSDIYASEKVCQPSLVSRCVIEFATETVCMIMKIDDIVQTR